jgi:ABC-type phosphate/phosphonate transport system permease subunit
MMLVASAGPNAMAGVLALSLHGIGMIGKLYAEISTISKWDRWKV